MSFDAKWIDLPVGNKLVRDKAQTNLQPDELYQMQDLEPIHERGTLGLRRAHEKVTTTPVAVRFPQEMAEQSRLDGEKFIAVVGRSEADESAITESIVFVDSATGIAVDPTLETFGTNGNRVPSFNESPFQNIKDIGVAISPDAIRTLSTRGRGYLGWFGRLNHVFPDGRFNDWNLSNRPAADEITSAEEYLGSTNDLSPKQAGVTLSVVSGDDANVNGWYDYGDSAAYAYSLVWEGGQESEISTPIVHTNTTANTSVRFNVAFIITDYQYFPKRVRSVRIYRSRDVDDSGNIKLSSAKFYLIKEKFIYESDQEILSESLGGVGYDQDGQIGWSFDSTRAIFNAIDYKSKPITRTYFDNQRIHQTVKNITPARARQRNFADRTFAWRVVDENGVQWNNRLYYSHYNGFGLHCRDIIPPANFVPFETINNIFDVIEVGNHRVIIGDTNYASGYIAGDIDGWQIHQGETLIGCVAENSVAKTPYGALFIGRDGLYLITGSQFEGPLGREVFWEIEKNPNLSSAIAKYSQKTGDYYFYIPDEDDETKGTQFYAFNLQTKMARKLTHPSGDTIRAMCVGSDGGVVFLTEKQISRIETLTGVDDPEGYIVSPVFETGYVHLAGQGEFQGIEKIGLLLQSDDADVICTIKGYPSGQSKTVTFEAQPEPTWLSKGIPTGLPIDFSHSFKFERSDKTKTLTAFKVQDIKVKAKAVGMEMP